jgi:hypothetical protein
MRSLALGLAAAVSLAAVGLGQEARAITLGHCTSLGGLSSFGNCYIGNPHEMTWTEHEATAQSIGSDWHIASIHSHAENAFIWNFFGDSLHPEDWARFIWIGLNDAASEGSFEWADGSPIDFDNWYPGQPDDADPGEDYGHLGFFGLWNDFPDEYYLKAVYSTPIESDPIHIPPPPPPPSAIAEPATLALFGLGLAGIGFTRRRRTA